MVNDQCCSNCNKYKPTEFCKHDSIDRILKQEKYQTCPFWMPMSPKKKSPFMGDVVRKIKNDLGIKD